MELAHTSSLELTLSQYPQNKTEKGKNCLIRKSRTQCLKNLVYLNFTFFWISLFPFWALWITFWSHSCTYCNTGLLISLQLNTTSEYLVLLVDRPLNGSPLTIVECFYSVGSQILVDLQPCPSQTEIHSLTVYQGAVSKLCMSDLSSLLSFIWNTDIPLGPWL